MATQSENKQQKKNWAEIDAEQEARERKPKIKLEISTYVREKEGESQNQKIQETVKVTKLIFPVRKTVKKRKKMSKFGEVIDVPMGQSKPGDKLLVADVNIQTNLNAEKGEIDIVNQIDKITTDKLKMKKDQEKIQQLQNKNVAQQPEQKNQQKDDGFKEVKDKKAGRKLSDLEFENKQEEFTIEVCNILSLLEAKSQQQIEEEENAFKQYLEQTIGKSGFQNRYIVKFLSRRGKTRELIGKVLVIFNNLEQAENAIDRLDQQEYKYAILDSGWYQGRRR